MTAPLRVIDTAQMCARWNVAATAALTELHGAGKIGDTLRFHRYPEAVLVGRHQALSRAIRVEQCRQDGIEIARRVTGGGAVYMAPGALAWDLVIDRKRAGTQVSHAAQHVGQAVAAGLSRLGLSARYRFDNEIEVAGRKICGMSGYRDGETVVCQGTILVDTDLAAMTRYLRLPSKGPRNVERILRARVATVAEFLGRVPDHGELESAICAGLSNALGCDPVHCMVSQEERGLADAWHGEEFGQDCFVFADPPTRGRDTLIGHDGGVVVFIKLHSGMDKRIDQIWLTGNFAVSPSRAILDLEAALRGILVVEAPRKAAEFLDRRIVEIRGASRFCIAGAISRAH